VDISAPNEVAAAVLCSMPRPSRSGRRSRWATATWH